MSNAFEGLRFAVIDVEGNGQQPPEIIEIAVQPIDGLSVRQEPTVWLVKPDRPIAPIVTRKVHGIRNADVADAPTWPEIASDVAATLASRIPVAHNARVEYDVLRRQMPTWGPTVVLDTLKLARAVWPDLSSYSLDPLLDHAGVPLSDELGRRHRAGFDVRATALLFIVLANAAGSQDRLFAAATLPGLVPADSQDTLW
jgi:DNA polymerase III epsilon subunit-like protein